MVVGSSKFGIAVIGLAVVSAMGLACTSLLGHSPSDAARSRAVPDLPVPTVPVEYQHLRETVRVPCEPQEDLTTVATPPAQGQAPTVVTDIGVAVGDSVKTGTLLAEVSGRPMIGIVTDVPFYRDLAVGDVGEDVERLERALMDTGLMEASDAHFDATSGSALNDLYAQADVEPHAMKEASGRFLFAMFESVQPGATVRQILSSTGEVLDAGQPIMVIDEGDVGVACTIASSVDVSAGQAVELVGAEGRVKATINDVGRADDESMTRVLVVSSQDDISRTGGPVDLEISLDATETEVATVPAGALYASPGGGYEVRRRTPDGYEAIAVELGMSVGGVVELRGARTLKPSDVVFIHSGDEGAPLGEDEDAR